MSRALGAFLVRVGKPGAGASHEGPLSSDAYLTNTLTRPFYGLSPVFRIGAADATLSALELAYADGGALAFAPAFASATTAYDATVMHPAGVVTIEAAPTDGNATVEYRWADGGVIPDEDRVAPGHQVALAVGANAIEVRVTAEDRVARETYTVTVTREAAVSPLPPLDCRADAVWCTTMVAEFNEEAEGYGYCPAGTLECDHGSLDVDAFILDGAGYGVESVRLLEAFVHLSLDRDLPAARLAALTLRVGPHVLALDEAIKGVDPLHPYFAHDYEWSLPAGADDFLYYNHEVDDLPLQVTVQLSVAPNIAAGGKPRIVGGPRVGRTVAADTGDVFDLNGLSGVAFAYQWVRVDGGTETDIASATASTYMPVAADVGKTLKVRVTFTDNHGYAEARTSDATGAVTDTAVDTDTALVALTLEAAGGGAVALDPAFASATTEYAASVGSGVGQVTIRATTRDNDASFEYLDGDDMELEDADGMAQGFQVALAEGENTVKVTVTAENGNSTRTYEVTITRAQETVVPGACLSDVAWCATLTVGESTSGAEPAIAGPGPGIHIAITAACRTTTSP